MNLVSERNKKEEMKKQSNKKTSLGGFVQKFKTSKGLRIGTIVVAAVLVLFFGFAIYAATYDDIFPGVTINGIDVGGMSVEEAERVIQSQIVDPVANRTIVLKCEDNEKVVSVFDLAPNGIDASYIAKQAFDAGRSDGFFSQTFSFMGSLLGTEDIKASVELDSDVVKGIIAELSKEYETDVQETEYSLNGNILTITRGKGGRRVDEGKAMRLVSEALVDSSVSEVVFVIEDAEPKAVDIDEFYSEITKPAQDAAYKKEDGKFVVVDEVDGIVVDKEKIADALNSGKEKVEIKVELKKASKTAADLKKMLFRDVMGEWSSNYSTSSAARATNVELTADRINGYVLLPGEVFSYDKTIGSRTVANGYKSAGVYVGNKVESGIGGGICQTSSTLYGAVLYANLEIVARTSHSLPVAYVPGGQDATIAEGYIDFQFKNNTEYPVKIVATYSNRQLVCKILGVKPSGQTVELVHSYTGSLQPKVDKISDGTIPKGYKKTVTKGKAGSTYSSKRIVKVNGSEVKNEALTRSVYNATNTEIRVNPEDMGTSPDALAEYTDEVIEAEKKKAEENATEETVETPGNTTENPTDVTDEAPITESEGEGVVSSDTSTNDGAEDVVAETEVVDEF